MSVDTFLPIDRGGGVTNLNIHRDDTYGILSGTIVDEYGGPIPDVVIDVEGIVSYSMQDGSFIVRIPIQKQKIYPSVTITKNGYRPVTYTRHKIGRNWEIMLIKQ